MSTSEKFLALVSEWYAPNVNITEVSPRGTDWGGSTEVGFHASFCVDVEGVNKETGAKIYDTIEGDNMEALWLHIMRSV